MLSAISEGHGDTALVLLRAGAETDKRDTDGNLAINLAPDKKVGRSPLKGAYRTILRLPSDTRLHIK